MDFIFELRQTFTELHFTTEKNIVDPADFDSMVHSVIVVSRNQLIRYQLCIMECQFNALRDTVCNISSMILVIYLILVGMNTLIYLLGTTRTNGEEHRRTSKEIRCTFC